MLNIHKYGNTTSATIPLCLVEWENQLKKGDNIILTTFGAGFTWGAMYVKGLTRVWICLNFSRFTLLSHVLFVYIF